MSSATPNNVYRITEGILHGPAEEPGSSKCTEAISPRRLRLERLWSFYRCTNYDNRQHDWDGRKLPDVPTADLLAYRGQVDAGYYDGGESLDISLKARRPDAPYFLAKVVVKRFNALLFSTEHRPKVLNEDPDTTAWLEGFMVASRFWRKMLIARTYGGAMGAVGLGLRFVDGVPIVEAFDPRITTPVYDSSGRETPKEIIIQYQYAEKVRTVDGVEDRWFWYRRVIDAEKDSTWPKVPVSPEGEEPQWGSIAHNEKEHGIGEIPAVWIQNVPNEEEVDGDPDCAGCFETIECRDALDSQANRGVKANCDPSVVIASNSEFDVIEKGTGNALQVEQGGNAKYMEMTGSGVDKAMALADRFEKQVLTVSQCHLDTNMGGPSRTASEVEHNFSAMLNQTDVLRDQYGTDGIKRLLELALRAGRVLAKPKLKVVPGVEGEKLVADTIRLPRGRKKDELTGKVEYFDRVLGNGVQVDLEWPPYFKPSLKEIGSAVDAAAKARTQGVMDMKHTVQFVSRFFDAMNVAEVMANIRKEQPAPAQLLGIDDDDDDDDDDGDDEDDEDRNREPASLFTKKVK